MNLENTAQTRVHCGRTLPMCVFNSPQSRAGGSIFFLLIMEDYPPRRDCRDKIISRTKSRISKHMRCKIFFKMLIIVLVIMNKFALSTLQHNTLLCFFYVGAKTTDGRLILELYKIKIMSLNCKEYNLFLTTAADGSMHLQTL